MHKPLVKDSGGLLVTPSGLEVNVGALKNDMYNSRQSLLRLLYKIDEEAAREVEVARKSLQDDIIDAAANNPKGGLSRCAARRPSPSCSAWLGKNSSVGTSPTMPRKARRTSHLDERLPSRHGFFHLIKRVETYLSFEVTIMYSPKISEKHIHPPLAAGPETGEAHDSSR